ncbi:hypothetical protein C8J57DRAFT_1612132 [Mycena rebaudengoi]|nr:hypothetical protein C8J57DRAFT_1612132 [Mycena rebaudengoi]
MLQSKGRIVGRVVDMFSNIEIIIAKGIARSPEDDDELFTAKDNLLYGTYIELLKTIPTLHDLINKLGKESAAKEIGSWIDAGRKDARNSDVSTVKGKILYWYKFDPPFGVARHNNGFHHAACGKLLCLDILDWQDPKVKEKLRDRLVQIKAGDFHSFLWAEEHCDKNNFYAGFLQHLLLVRGYLCVFYGPAAAKKGTPGGHGHGNAQIHNITVPTFPAIVYIVILIHFALSSQTSFDAGGTPGKFPYRGMYRELLATIAEMPQEVRERLLTWWTEKTHGLPDDAEAAISTLDPEAPAPTMAQMMRDYAAKLAEQEVEPQAPAEGEGSHVPAERSSEAVV